MDVNVSIQKLNREEIRLDGGEKIGGGIVNFDKKFKKFKKFNFF